MPNEVGMSTRAIYIYNNYQLIINETLYIYRNYRNSIAGSVLFKYRGTAALVVCCSNTEEQQRW